MRDGAGAVIMQLFVVVSADIATRENVFQVLGECRIDRHQIFELTVDRAFLNHQDFAIALDDFGFDFANGFVQKDFVIDFAINNFLADFRNAPGTKGICFTRPAEWWLGLFVALQERFIGPLRSEGRLLIDAVDPVKICQAALALTVTAFSKYLTGLCML